MSAADQHDIDRALVQRLKMGDEAAMSQIIDRHWGSTFQYAAGLVRTPEIAEDVTQESFVKLWEHRDRYREVGPLRAYLFRIARNRIRGIFRHLRVTEVHATKVRSTIEKAPPTPHDLAVESELRSALEAALDSIPPRRREAFVLVRLKGYSLAEAAEAMGLSRQTVANHVSLAISNLDVALREYRR